MIVGVDHGYGGMKTVHTAVPTAIAKYEQEPAVASGHMLVYEGSYYRIGGRRIHVRTDKTSDEMYWILTLYAIAAEIEARQLPREQTVVLAAGLPLAELSIMRDSFRSYLHRSGVHQFRLDDREYRIVIDDVQLYPQGYAAIMPVIDRVQTEPVVHVVDIGAWTTDTVSLVHGIADDGSEHSLEHGVIRCLAGIRKRMRQEENRTYSDQQIENVLWENRGLTHRTRKRMQEICTDWCTETLRRLDEAGLDTVSAPVYFLGGGAVLLNRYLPEEMRERFLHAVFLTDVKANARGYESICSSLLQAAS